VREVFIRSLKWALYWTIFTHIIKLVFNGGSIALGPREILGTVIGYMITAVIIFVVMALIYRWRHRRNDLKHTNI
jgi:hypothetical protein